MKKVGLALCAALLPMLAAASESEGLVVSPLATQYGAVMFGVATSGTVTGTKPSCATGPQWTQWAFDAKTVAGRNMYATVLQAQALGKVLHVVGKGNCDAWGDRESVDFLFMTN
jgi:hypothetical protein